MLSDWPWCVPDAKGRFSIDDAVCAGMLLGRLKERLGGTLEVEDAGRAALALAEAFVLDDALFEDAAAGRALAEIDMVDDLSWCVRVDVEEWCPSSRSGSSNGLTVAGRKKSHPKKGTGGGPGLGSDQRRELLALALLALALFLLLALVPVPVLGPRIGAIFPSGNAIGRVGAATAEGMWTALGAAAVLIPALLLLGGLRAGGWLGRETTLRLGALGIGLLLFVPPGLYVWVPDSQSDGWLGRALGGPLVSALSWLGSLLLLSVLVVALSVVTLGWQPMRAVGQGVALGGGALGRDWLPGESLGAVAVRTSAPGGGSSGALDRD